MSRLSPTSSMSDPASACTKVANWPRIKIATAVLALFLYGGATSTASAAIITEVIGCLALTCVVEPIGGPVAVDPTSFTLEVAWSEVLRLLDLDDRGLLRLTFEFSGEHEGTEHFSDVELLDTLGNPIPTRAAGFDDAHAGVGILIASFDITRGPEAFLGGFRLGPSDGSGVDTLQWTRADIYPTELVPVPEPSTLILLTAGLGLTAMRRRWHRG
jgi:hypothetical protein